jgi:hypothetical protein
VSQSRTLAFVCCVQNGFTGDRTRRASGTTLTPTPTRYHTYSAELNAARDAKEPDRGARGHGHPAAVRGRMPDGELNPSAALAIADLEPLLLKYEVDFYFAVADLGLQPGTRRSLSRV